MRFLDLIQDNIGWIKELFSIVFSGAATVLAILTYLRAKETFLQPVRSEVIKKQARILTEMFTEIGDCKPQDLDYLGIVVATVFISLDSYGFVFKGHKEILEKINKNIVGKICSVKDAMDKILEEILMNLTVHMKSTIEKCLMEFSKEYQAKTEIYPFINPAGVYNEFNHNRIHHNKSSGELWQAVRHYLKIDEVPW